MILTICSAYHNILVRSKLGFSNNGYEAIYSVGLKQTLPGFYFLTLRLSPR